MGLCVCLHLFALCPVLLPLHLGHLAPAFGHFRILRRSVHAEQIKAGAAVGHKNTFRLLRCTHSIELLLSIYIFFVHVFWVCDLTFIKCILRFVLKNLSLCVLRLPRTLRSPAPLCLLRLNAYIERLYQSKKKIWELTEVHADCLFPPMNHWLHLPEGRREENNTPASFRSVFYMWEGHWVIYELNRNKKWNTDQRWSVSNQSVIP